MVSVLPSHLSKKLVRTARLCRPRDPHSSSPRRRARRPRLPDLWALGMCMFPCHGDPASRFLGYPASGDVSLHRLQVHGGGPVAGVSGCGVAGTRGQPSTLRRWQELCLCPSAVPLLSHLHLTQCKQRGWRCMQRGWGGWSWAGGHPGCVLEAQGEQWPALCCLTTSSVLKQNQLPTVTCLVFPFLWHKHSLGPVSGCRATPGPGELGRDGPAWLSLAEPIPAHHRQCPAVPSTGAGVQDRPF